MMSTVKEKVMKYAVKTEKFEIQPHPQHDRLYHIVFDTQALNEFFDAIADTTVQQLEYTPYTRFIVAEKLLNAVGQELKDYLRAIVNDRESGGFTVGAQNVTKDHGDYVKLSTAIAYLNGTSNFDSMTGKYYARFTVKDTDGSDFIPSSSIP
jgi:protein CsiD